VNRGTDPDLGEIETLLRRRLNELADHAPATVRQPDQLIVSPSMDTVPNRRRRAAGIGATIAVIAGGLGISTLAFQGAGSPGGADSPEEAVRAFADALEREDVLGMIEVALPEELSALRAVLDDATREVERVGILDESFSLSAVEGIDVRLPGLTFTTENLDTDLAVVTATGGTADATFDPALLPLGSIVREVIGDELATSELSRPLSGTDPSVMLATVARDGRWYVSLGFTVAEYARAAAGADFPLPVTIDRVGHESPEAAALGFYERLAALDLEGAMAMLAPGEGDALLRYSPLFLPEAIATIERGRAEGLTLSISGVEFDTSGSGDRRTLTPVSFVVDGTVPSTWGVVMDADPTIPTVIYNVDGRIAIVPAGELMPATIDEVELVTELPPELQDRYNTTFALPDGTIQPIEFPSGASDEPQPFRFERNDGCTELTGPGIDALLPGIGMWAGAGTDYSEVDGGRRFCGEQTPFGGSMFTLLLVSASPIQLPGISVVESDGLWYVSPIGTLGASIVDAVRSVPDGANLIDTPIAAALFEGMGRQAMDATLAAVSTIPPECEQITAVDADGVATVIPDPPVSEIRGCVRALYSAGVSTGSYGPAPVQVDAAVPASTAPAAVADDAGG
jgi:hypothetical protein